MSKYPELQALADELHDRHVNGKWYLGNRLTYGDLDSLVQASISRLQPPVLSLAAQQRLSQPPDEQAAPCDCAPGTCQKRPGKCKAETPAAGWPSPASAPVDGGLNQLDWWKIARAIGDVDAHKLAGSIVAKDAEVARLQRELDGARADAERYRWLREQNAARWPTNSQNWNAASVTFNIGHDWVEQADLDAAIDAARTASAGEKP